MIDILGILRVIFGLLFLFFVPGFALLLALFPKKELGIAERIGFSGALSIVADMLTVLFIDLVLHIPTTALNIVLSLLTLTAFALIIWRLELFFLKLREKGRKETQEGEGKGVEAQREKEEVGQKRKKKEGKSRKETEKRTESEG
ncbi:MAG: DUF1616 domain-containing protein [Candidatus Methanospirare jalkutatii]|nr:DUF1616 domain-containing protein [Candidatus Methanospirare jalkutatii]